MESYHDLISLFEHQIRPPELAAELNMLPNSVRKLKGQRQHDPQQLAKAIIDIATAERPNRILWRGGEVDTICGFDTEHAAMDWIKDKSAKWILQAKE